MFLLVSKFKNDGNAIENCLRSESKKANKNIQQGSLTGLITSAHDYVFVLIYIKILT